MRIALFALLSFLLAACSDTADTAVASREATQDPVADVAVEPASGSSAAEDEAATFLQTTTAAVEAAGGDITALSPEAAANNINGWITKLIHFEGTEDVVDDLADLKKELMIGEMDSAKVSGILGSLATSTRELSDRAVGLGMLADVLQAGSDKLADK